MTQFDPAEGWRLHMKMAVPAPVLKRYAKHHGYSVRTLAEAVTRATREQCSRASIGHLFSGERTTIGDNKARAIEEILDVPRGTLFVPTLSRVSRDVTGRRYTPLAEVVNA
jgi:hypothetical protein